jgi:hypothetical protein
MQKNRAAASTLRFSLCLMDVTSERFEKIKWNFVWIYAVTSTDVAINRRINKYQSGFLLSTTMITEFYMWSVPRCYKQDSLKQRAVVGCICQQFSWVKWLSWWVSVQLSVGSQPVKRRLGDLCEMAAILGPSSLGCRLTSVLHEWLWQRGPQCSKLKNLPR